MASLHEHHQLRGFPLLTYVTLLALALSLTACEDDSGAGPADTPTEHTHVIRSVDPIAARFFRLTAPVSFFFTDPDSFPMPMRDSSLDFVQSEQGPTAPWRIDYTSLRVYRSIDGGMPDGEAIVHAIAYLDPKGVGFEGFGAGTGLTPGDSGPNPGYPYSGFDPAIALAGQPQQYRAQWELLEPTEDWDILEVNGQIIGIYLSRPATDNEVIAVSYEIRDRDTREIVRRVGRSSEDGESGRIEDPTSPGRQVHYFKLLKPGSPIAQPFASGAYTRFALAWEYEYRNFYDLGGTEIPPEELEFWIVSTDATFDPPDRMPADIDPNQIRFIQVFGLDQQTRTGVLSPDGLADIENWNLFRLPPGFLRFPHPTPMYLPDSLVTEYSGGRVTALPSEMSAPGLYTRILTLQERSSMHHFDFEVRWVE